MGSVHLPDRAGAPGGPESAELANRFLPYKRRHPIEMARLRVMGGVETQQLSQQGAHERPRLQAEQHQHAEQRLYVWRRNAEARSPSRLDGPVQGRLAGHVDLRPRQTTIQYPEP